jgi:hypothetical protein
VEVEVEVPVDVTRYRFAEADDFEEPWHLAVWVPHEQGGPTVFINQDSPEVVKAQLRQLGLAQSAAQDLPARCRHYASRVAP